MDNVIIILLGIILFFMSLKDVITVTKRKKRFLIKNTRVVWECADGCCSEVYNYGYVVDCGTNQSLAYWDNRLNFSLEEELENLETILMRPLTKKDYVFEEEDHDCSWDCQE